MFCCVYYTFAMLVCGFNHIVICFAMLQFSLWLVLLIWQLAPIQDGGYHVPFAHKGLAEGLQMDSYASNLYPNLSIQSCAPQRALAAPDKRLGEPPPPPRFYPSPSKATLLRVSFRGKVLLRLHHHN